MAVMLRKSLFMRDDLIKLADSKMLSYFKKGILSYLKSLDAEPGKVEKAIYGVGTIRTWKGKKYIKSPDKKWRRYYDKESRGASVSIKSLMKKVDKATSPEELLQLVLLHRDRFADEYGHPVPIIQELSRYVNTRQGKINAAQAAAKPAPGKVDRSKLEIGDHYVAESDSVSGGEGKFVVRTVRKDGNDGYVSAVGQLGFGGIKKFNTREEAEKWIRDNPVKNKTTKQARPTMTASERVLKEDHPTLEKYVNKEIDRKEFRERLVKLGYSVADITEIEGFAATLKPTDWNTPGKAQFFVRNKHDSYMGKWGWGHYAHEEDGFATKEEAQAAADQWNEKYGGDVSVVGRDEARIMDTEESKEKKSKSENKQFSHEELLEDLNEGWGKGIFTIKDVADNLRDGDVFQGWSADIWKTAARDESEYRAGEISGKELEKRQEKLFSEENKIKEKNGHYTPDTGKSALQQWEQTGADDFKAGKPHKPPYPWKGDWAVGSPESEDALNKVKAWLRGWEKANLAADIPYDEEAEEKITRLLAADKDTSKGVQREVIGKARNPEIMLLKKELRIDASDYNHTIDKSEINHTIKKHGDEKNEAQRGQIAITKDDFKLIPLILKTHDKIEYVGKNDKGLDAIQYSKELDGVIIVIEEVRTGKKELAFSTMYKKKKGSGSVQKPSARTPETTPQQKVSPESGEKSSPRPEKNKYGAIRKALEAEGQRVKIVFLKKAVQVEKPTDDRFEEFKSLITEHLEGIENNDEEIKKAGLPVGTIRNWNGKDYVKVSPGKWRPKYNSHSRGAKMAVSHIKRKVDAATTSKQLMDIVMENRDRFSDAQGNPLPFVQELSKYVSERQEYLPENIKAKRKEARSNAIKAGQEKARKKKEEAKQAAEENKRQKAERMKAQDLDRVIDYYGGTNAKREGDKVVITEMGKDKRSPVLADTDRMKREWRDMNIEYSNGKITITKKGRGNKQEESTADKTNKYGVPDEVYNAAIKPYLSGDISLNSLKHKLENAGLSKNKVGRLANSLWEETHPDPEKEIAEKQAEEYNKIPYEKRKEMAEEAIKRQDKMLGNDSGDSQDDMDFQAIRDKYQNGKNIEGQEDEIYIGNETQKGRWKLVEADTPSASHDESTFHKTRGFPKNKDGSTINDRDYESDRAAQETVMSMGANFDGRALSFDSPVVVTKDGVVVSGNNRTMSSKIAARRGTDTKYVDALKKRAERFGFSGADIDGFKHPRIVFEIEKDGDYSTGEFAKYNQESQKTMSPIESAVKVSKIIKSETVKDIAGHIAEFETMGELYTDRKVCMSIFNALETGGIINQFNRNTYIEPEGTITGAGKEFLETVLIGSVINEQNIRGLNRDGCKHIRAKLVRAITPLVNNKSMGGYSIMEELNSAVDLYMQYNIEKDKFGSLDDLVKQGTMFEAPSEIAVELARKMQMNQKDFADFLQKVNASLELGASGQSDIFLGGVEEKDDILKRFLDIKKSIDTVIRKYKERKDRLMEKSLTWSGHKLQGRTRVQGMDISIENKKGSVRSGTDKDGHDWSIKMNYHYGYIRGTVGKDKDHLDVYLGPNPESETVYIVHQNDPTTGDYDEDKVMLGFDSIEEAKSAYLSQYDRPGFLGEIDTMDIDTFKEKAFNEKNKGKMLK